MKAKLANALVPVFCFLLKELIERAAGGVGTMVVKGGGTGFPAVAGAEPTEAKSEIRPAATARQRGESKFERMAMAKMQKRERGKLRRRLRANGNIAVQQIRSAK